MHRVWWVVGFAVLGSNHALPPLRSAQFCFVGSATGALSISTEVLRKGKSTVLVASDLTDEGGLAVRSTCCFGVGRESSHDHQSFVMPNVPAPDECRSYYTWPIRPNFINHFEGQLALGARSGTPVSLNERLIAFEHGWWLLAVVTALTMIPTIKLLGSTNSQPA